MEQIFNSTFVKPSQLRVNTRISDFLIENWNDSLIGISYNSMNQSNILNFW